ncbi:MliC family protein [Brucella intermedia]|uniref:MliC family protein n=1 Tax=Brucella TaxID=234 RepID=UPI00094647A4|nr:MliC family protein [Brucella intermedia]
MKHSATCALLLILSMLVLPAHAAEYQEVPDIIQKTYVCERGALVPVTYVNMDDGDSLAIAVLEGRQVVMTLAPSASGVRYVAINEQESYRWHSKGDKAVLSFMTADHEAEEKPLLSECQAQKQ